MNTHPDQFQLDKSPFSQSLIWQLQRDYFENAGITAWQSGEVPHYVSSNPVVGKTYAEIILAFLKDRSLQGHAEETVYLLELGAGHGRLGYHFLKHIEKYQEQSAVRLPPFCYVLSDFTAANLEFWKTHPRLQPYIQKGWLDFALFNAESDTELTLSERVIRNGELNQPVVVLANYFFDTIPQDLFRIQKDQIEQALLSVSSNKNPKETSPADLISSLTLEYTYQKVDQPVYKDRPILNELLIYYQDHLTDTHLLLPHIGIQCLERLKSLSTSGLLLLTADKGEHHLSNLNYILPPQLSRHGSFSLNVNFHALKWYGEYQEGLSLFPLHQHHSLDLGCILIMDNAHNYLETITSYDKVVQDFGPDDYFDIKKLVEKGLGSLSFRDVMAVVKLSGYDARIFQQMLPDMYDQLEHITANDRWNLLLAIPRIWDTFFPILEEEDLAANLGDLLVQLQFPKEALLYYQKSFSLYGRKTEVRFNEAICHWLLEDRNMARTIILELWHDDPEDKSIRKLMQDFGVTPPK